MDDPDILYPIVFRVLPTDPVERYGLPPRSAFVRLRLMLKHALRACGLEAYRLVKPAEVAEHRGKARKSA